MPSKISCEVTELTHSPVLSFTLTYGTSGRLILSTSSASCIASSIALSFATAMATFLSAVKISISFAWSSSRWREWCYFAAITCSYSALSLVAAASVRAFNLA